MLTTKEIKACTNIDDLLELGIAGLKYEIDHRGGYIGYNARCVFNHMEIPEKYLEVSTGTIGAFCNYLGGGVRGTITFTIIDESIPVRHRRKLQALVNACYRAYWSAENEMHLNDLTYGDGETNYDATATMLVRGLGLGDEVMSRIMR